MDMQEIYWFGLNWMLPPSSRITSKEKMEKEIDTTS